MDEVTRILIFTILFTLSAAILVILSFIISRRRQIQYKKQLLEQEYKTRETALLQVSRDLHDDIGSSLSGINMLGQLVQQQLNEGNYQSANELLQKINNYTNELIEKISNMAWLLKPSDESLSILISRLKFYNLPAASLKNINLQFNITTGESKKELTIQQRKAIYLISKEAINNAIKYSQCNTIFYSLHAPDNKIELIVRDDGVGFDMPAAGNGNGLQNMKTRADEIGAGFTIQSSPGQGTKITLQF